MAGKKRDGIYKRGRIWWISTDPITKRPESTKCSDIEAARGVYATRQRLAADPHHAAAHTARLVDWIGKMLDVRRRKRSAATVTYYAAKLGHFPRVFGADCVLADITPPAVDRYIAQRRDETASEHTISKEVAALQIVLRLAKRAGCYGLDVDGLRPDDLTPEYAPKERALPAAEVEALLAELEPHRAALVRVAVGLGCRLSEAFSLRPEDINLGTSEVLLRGTKTAGAWRSVPLLSAFRAMVVDAIPHLPLKRWQTLHRDLKRACKRAKIAPCTPNDLRRSHATLLEEAGVSEQVLYRLLGHTTPAMLRRVYGKPRPAALGELAERAIDRSQFVAKPTAREHCTPSASGAKCSEALTSDDIGQSCDGFLIHWSWVRVPVDPPRKAISPGLLSLKRSVMPGLARAALLYAAERVGVVA